MSKQPACKTAAIGGDHAGFSMKSQVSEHLSQRNLCVIDCGAQNESPSDFPDFAERVSELIISGKAERGILVCGSGVGVCVAANKIPGIRAGLCHDTYSAHQGVEHDDMNVLCIGARIIGSALALEIVDAFLCAQYTPQERHRRRVDKLLAIEQKALNGEYRST